MLTDRREKFERQNLDIFDQHNSNYLSIFSSMIPSINDSKTGVYKSKENFNKERQWLVNCRRKYNENLGEMKNNLAEIKVLVEKTKTQAEEFSKYCEEESNKDISYDG